METWHYIAGGFVLVIPWLVMAIFFVTRGRRQQTGVVSDTLSPAIAAVTTAVAPVHQPMDVVLAAMAARLGVVEADTRVIATQLNAVNELQVRLAAVESAIPAVQSAFESYADQISRTDKRDTERVRRTEKVQEKAEAKTAGEAAAEMMDGAQPLPAAAVPNEVADQRARAGVVGQGGRQRHRKTGGAS